MSRKYLAVLVAGAVVVLSGAVPRVYALCTAPQTDGVSLQVHSSLQQTVASASVGYTGTIQNAGESSYDDAALAVEVRSASTSQVVDRFVQKGIVVPAGVPTPVTFVWRTPGGLAPGAYKVNVIFVPASVGYGDAFSDARLPHTSTDMTIASGAKPGAALSGSITSSAPGVVSLAVVNAAKAPYRGTVTWKVWGSDTGISGEPVVQKTEEVEMMPNGNAVAKYLVPHSENGSYYVEATLAANNSIQAVAGAWIVKGAVSATNTSCDTVLSGVTGMIPEIGILILVIAIVLLGWGYMHKHQIRSKESRT